MTTRRPTNIVFDILAKDNASKVFDKMSDKLAGQERALNGLRVAGTAQFVALAAAGALYAKSAIENSRDLGETVNMATVIFGDQADEMIAWAETADEAAGLSKQAALQATATFGDMFTQLGFTSDAAALMSKDTVQLSADLGSFRNLPTEDVLNRISAAMRGEYDSLQLLIPNINAARVEQVALAETGKKTAKELTAQEKVAATLAIVHKDSASAAGDFARTSGDLAGQQKILQAVNENLSAQLGQDLLPVALAVTSAAREMVKWTSEHETATKFLVVTIGTLSTAIAVAANWQKIHQTATTLSVAGQMVWEGVTKANQAALSRMIPTRVLDMQATSMSTTAVTGLTAATKASTVATTASTKAMSASKAALGPIGALLTVAAVAVAVFSSRTKEATVVNQSLVDSFDDLTGAVTETTRELVYNELVSNGSVDAAKTLGVGLDVITDAALGNASAVAQVNDALVENAKRAAELKEAEGLSSQSAYDLEAAVTTLSGGLVLQGTEVQNSITAWSDQQVALKKTTDATKDGTAATEDQADAVKTLVEVLEEQIKKQREAAGVVLDENSARREYEKAIDDATAAIAENGNTLDVTTEQGRNNQAALDDIASSTWEWIEAGSAAGESQIVLADRMGQGRQSFIDTATQLELTADQAAALADEMGLIPTQIVTDISLSGYADTYRYLSDIQAKIRSITGNSQIRVAMGAGGSGGLTLAGGGPVVGPGTWTSDSVPAWLSNNEFVHTAAAHNFWGTQAMHAINNRDVAGFFSAMSLEGFAGGGSLSAATFAGASAMDVYRGLPATSQSVSPSGGTAVFHLYDTDGALMGTMRGAADNSARFTQQARSAAMRGGGGR